MKTLFQSIPTAEGVRKVGPGQGEKFEIAGAHLTWKVKGRTVDMPFLFANKRLLRVRGFRSIAILPPRSFMYFAPVDVSKPVGQR